MWPLRQGNFWPQVNRLNKLGRGLLDKAGLVVSEEKMFESIDRRMLESFGVLLAHLVAFAPGE